MRVSIVVAAARGGVIGLAGRIPWRLPDDQRFFRRLTYGSPIVMGRKTFESIGRALPGRANLVLTRGELAEGPGLRRFRTLAAAERWASDEGFPELFVIGGEAVYREALGHADRVFLTRVDAAPDGDAFFPELDESVWRLARAEPHAADARHAHSFSIETWLRSA